MQNYLRKGSQWDKAVNSWIDEHKDYKFGTQPTSATGHYTQVTILYIFLKLFEMRNFAVIHCLVWRLVARLNPTSYLLSTHVVNNGQHVLSN